MTTFRSTGHTVFREGDPAIPDIAAEKRGVPPSAPENGRDMTNSAGRITSSASRRLRKGSGLAGRVFSQRNERSGVSRYELDEALAAGLREEADRRRLTEREVLEEAVRLYLRGSWGGGAP